MGTVLDGGEGGELDAEVWGSGKQNVLKREGSAILYSRVDIGTLECYEGLNRFHCEPSNNLQ